MKLKERDKSILEYVQCMYNNVLAYKVPGFWLELLWIALSLSLFERVKKGDNERNRKMARMEIFYDMSLSILISQVLGR